MSGKRQRFELCSGSSNKFWEIETSGPSLRVRFGRIGSAGQEKTRSFASKEAALAAAAALKDEKTRKGYREVRASTPAPGRGSADRAVRQESHSSARGPAMDRLVQQLAQALRASEEGEPPVGRPAAPEKRIRRFEKHLGLTLPPSYRAFLAVHDGYDRLAWPGHLRPIASLLPGGRWFKEHRRWQRELRGEGELDHEVIPIGSIDEATNWMLYLDPGRATADGELAVVEWTPAQSYVYESFQRYLEEELAARTKRTSRRSGRNVAPKSERAPKAVARVRPTAVVTPKKFRGKTYRLQIDHSLSWRERITAGQFGYVDEDVLKAAVPLVGSGVEKVDVHLVDLGRTGRRAAHKLRALGMVPARLEHLLAFAARYPTLAWREEILAVGSQIEREGDWPAVLRLRYDTVYDRRTLGQLRWRDAWEGSSYRFLALTG